MLPAILAALTLCAPAEFNPESTDWNGLSYLTTTAREASVTLRYKSEIDWSEKTIDEVLVLLHPTKALKLNQFINFIHDGGRAVVLVDQGASEDILALFGLQLAKEPVIHNKYYRDHPAFPELSPSSEHFLWFNVKKVVLNHPAALTQLPGPQSARIAPIMAFAEPGQHFAMEARLGDGEVLFVSDSSILINDMQLGVYGDKQLAANLFRVFATEKPVSLLTPGATGRGIFESDSARTLPLLERSFARAVSQFHALMHRLHDYLLNGSGLRVFTWALTLTAFFLLFALPLPGGYRRPSWMVAVPISPPAPLLRARAIAHGGRTADYTASAECLKRWYTDGLKRNLPGEPINSAGDDGLPQRTKEAIAKRAGDEIATLAVECTWSLQNAVPSEHAPQRQRKVLALADFERLWNDCELVIGALKSGE